VLVPTVVAPVLVPTVVPLLVPTVVPLPVPTVVPLLVPTVVDAPEPAAPAPPCPLASSIVTLPEQAAWNATGSSTDRTFQDCMIA
jgi:hypothetical protein